MSRVAIRADGGDKIGMGHIMRCLSLARELKKAGAEVLFFSRLDAGINVISSEGFEVVKISDAGLQTNNLEKEAAELQREIGRLKINILIVDTYSVSEKYFSELRSYVGKLVYIDDLNRFVYPVDILVNGNITGDDMNYVKYDKIELMLLGVRYNLIRNEFINLPQKKVNRDVNEIMITTGGSDPYGMSGKILKALVVDERLKEVRFNVVIGNGFNNIQELISLSRGYTNILLHHNVKNISELMKMSDLAISSAGSTLYELCACGTPVLAFIMVDNQRMIAEKLDRLKYIRLMGWHDEVSPERLLNMVLEMRRDVAFRKKTSLRQQGLIDGLGARRTAESILSSPSRF